LTWARDLGLGDKLRLATPPGASLTLNITGIFNGCAMLLVTHNREHALRCDRIVELADGSIAPSTVARAA